MFLFLCCRPKCSNVFPKRLLQDGAWAGGIGKSGQGLFGAGLGVGVEWRVLWPGAKSGCGARDTRGSGKRCVIGLYFVWHK